MVQKNKKGLSDIVTTVLIILLVIVAVAVIASFVLPAVRDTGKKVDANQACLSIDAQPVSCDDSDDKVRVKLNSGSPTALRVIVTTSAGVATPTEFTAGIPSLYGTADFGVTVGVGDKASVAAQVTIDGEKSYCSPNPIKVTCVA